MKRVFVFILLIFISLASIAQIQVKEGSFRRIVNYVMDDKDEHMDGNYMPMALIKISTENINAEERNKLYFKGNRATDFHVEPKIGELYLYISAEAATVLEIKHPDYGKTMFTFPEPLCDFCAYELVVQYTPYQGKEADNKPQNNFLTIVTDQNNAAIFIDDEYIGDKEAYKVLPIGTTHTYRIECDLYHSETGTVNITDGESITIEKQLRPAFGYLNVSSLPENGAVVYLDGKRVGETPYSSDRLASGTYKLRVVKEMYKTTEQTITITDGNTTTTSLDMSANFVNVSINTDSQSDIYIDGEIKGKGTWTGRLSEGTHFVEARKDKHKTSTKNINLTLGKDETIEIEAPQPIYGFLEISSNPIRADIYIDGKHFGQTPKVISDLLIGTHELRLEKKGCASVVKTITVKEGETLSINESLPTGKEVSIKTGKDGDRIYVDDNYVGLSPMIVNLSYGTHHIKAERGSQTTSKTIDVKVGNTAEEYLLAFGKIIRITSSARGDDIYVDRKKVGQTPMDIDISLGTHEVEVKRGKLYETKSIEVSKSSQSSYHFTPKKEPLDKYLENGVNFITLNGAYSVAPQTSFGITYGQVRKVGWFVSAMTNFNFRFSGEEFNNIGNETDTYTFSGRSSSARLSVMAGGILKVAGPVYARLGLGYGMRVKCWEINGKWYEYYADTYKGIDLSAGMQLNLRNVTLTADVVTTNFKTMEFKIGMGLNWKKR